VKGPRVLAGAVMIDEKWRRAVILASQVVGVVEVGDRCDVLTSQGRRVRMASTYGDVLARLGWPGAEHSKLALEAVEHDARKLRVVSNG